MKKTLFIVILILMASSQSIFATEKNKLSITIKSSWIEAYSIKGSVLTTTSYEFKESQVIKGIFLDEKIDIVINQSESEFKNENDHSEFFSRYRGLEVLKGDKKVKITITAGRTKIEKTIKDYDIYIDEEEGFGPEDVKTEIVVPADIKRTEKGTLKSIYIKAEDMKPVMDETYISSLLEARFIWGGNQNTPPKILTKGSDYNCKVSEETMTCRSVQTFQVDFESPTKKYILNPSQ